MAEYWVQQSMTQGLAPPSTQRSARAVLRFVASVPGAISYVPPADVDDTVTRQCRSSRSRTRSRSGRCALKLNIRWQLALVSVALSLLPIAVVGVLAYRIARGALEERIRFNLETLALQSDEKLERLLLDQHQNLRGVVAARLHPRRHGHGRCRRPHPAVSPGSQAQLRPRAGVLGRERGRHRHRVDDAVAARPRSRRSRVPAGRAPRRGVGRHARMQDLTGRVGMPLAFPLHASFDRSKPVGVLVAVLDWPKILVDSPGGTRAARRAGRARLPRARQLAGRDCSRRRRS